MTKILLPVRHYLPDILQSAFLALIMFAFCGNLIAAALLMLLGDSVSFEIKVFISDIISFVPALAFAVAASSRNARRAVAACSESGQACGDAGPESKSAHGKGTAVVYGLLAVLVIALQVLLEPLSVFVDTPEYLESLIEQMTNGGIISFFAIAVLPAFFEEYLFRGIILRGLLSKYAPSLAIIVSSLLFAIVHFNVFQAIPAFVIGCVMGWVFWKTGSICMTMFMHFANNGFSFMVSRLSRSYFPEAEYSWEIIENTAVSVILYIFMFALAAAIILFLNKKLTVRNNG